MGEGDKGCDEEEERDGEEKDADEEDEEEEDDEDEDGVGGVERAETTTSAAAAQPGCRQGRQVASPRTPPQGWPA
jgi:hypothetical protein